MAAANKSGKKHGLPEADRDRSGPFSSGSGKQKFILFLMAAPFVVHILIFYYGQIWGWSMAFVNYRIGVPILKSEFVGLKEFIRLFQEGSQFFQVLRNTLVFNFLGLLCMALPPLFAILLAEIGSSGLQRAIQTMTAFPYFISWVIVYSIFFNFLSNDGVINNLLLHADIIGFPIQFLQKLEYVWPLQTFISVWKELGWNAIIYISAIAAIDQQLFEAAKADGAGRFRRIIHITVPCMLPTFLVLMILKTGSMLSAFDQQFMFFNGLVAERMEVIDTFAYRKGLAAGDLSFATAVSIFKTAVSILLLTTTNKIARVINGKPIL